MTEPPGLPCGEVAMWLAHQTAHGYTAAVAGSNPASQWPMRHGRVNCVIMHEFDESLPQWPKICGDEVGKVFSASDCWGDGTKFESAVSIHKSQGNNNKFRVVVPKSKSDPNPYLLLCFCAMYMSRLIIKWYNKHGISH